MNLMEKFGYPVHLSERVEQLIRDGALDEIFVLVQQEIDEEWKRTPPKDVETREMLYHESHALRRLQIKLGSIVGSLKFERRGES